MPKNFLIGMGGSGEKAVEAFIYLAAAGMVAEGNDVQIAMIDQDTTCGNYKRTADTHTSFKEFSEVMKRVDANLHYKPCNIIYSNAWDLQQSVNEVAPNGNATDLKTTFGAEDGTDEADIIDCLFAAGEQVFKTNKGYYGHPTFGSLIVNAAMTTNSFRNNSILSDLRQAHQVGPVNIFLVGSNFGGTGAAMFPNVAKKLRESLDACAHPVRICGALLLPYFNLSAAVAPNMNNANRDIDVPHFYKKSAISLESYIKEPVGGYDVVYSGAAEKYIYDRIVLVGSPSLQNTVVDDNLPKNQTLGGDKQAHHLCLPDMTAALSACSFFSDPDGFCDIASRSVGTDTYSNLNYVAIGSNADPNEVLGAIHLNNLPGTNSVSQNLEKFTRFALMTVGYYAPMITRTHETVVSNGLSVRHIENNDYLNLFVAHRGLIRGVTELIAPEKINSNIHDLSSANLFLSNYLKTIYRIQSGYIDDGQSAGRMFECDAGSALGKVAPAAITKENLVAAGRTSDGWVENPNAILSILSNVVYGSGNVETNGTTIRQNSISGNDVKYDNVTHEHRVSRLLNLTFASC